MRNKGFLIAVSLLQFNLLKNIIFPDFISLTFCLEIPQQLQIGRDYCCARGGLCKRLSLERLVPEVTRVMSKHQRIKCISRALLDDGVLRNMVFAEALNQAKALSCICIAYLSGTVQGPRKMTSSTAMASISTGNCSEGRSEFNPDSSGSNAHRLILRHCGIFER